MIARIWHGWTTFENVSNYEELIKEKVFPSIEKKKISGYRKISLLKRTLKDEIEFITIMQFDNLNCIKNFMGENYAQSYVPNKARQVLYRYDNMPQHYEIVDEIRY